MMSWVRPPAVADLFYPADERRLRAEIDGLLGHAPDSPTTAPKALIVPHAGLPYSGPVAATGYRRLASQRERIRRVVLLGPSHRVPFEGLALSTARAFHSPLGAIPVDHEAVEALRALPQVTENDAAHAGEHSLEVQLPFLQRVLESFALVPLVVGDAPAAAAAEVIDTLWGGPETLVLVSSDLSHYLDYDTAQRLDSQTSAAIEALQPEAIGYEQACGRNPVNGLLTCARERALRVETLDRRCSGDTAGPRDRVVGYGTYAFH